MHTLSKSMLALATLTFALAIPMTASAEDVFKFKLATSTSKAEKKINAGIEDGISEMNFVVQPTLHESIGDTTYPT